MSRPPLAPRITDTLYDMYEDAKNVNAVTSEPELIKKLAVISAVNDNINRRLEELNRTSRPDPFMKRKLQAALNENQTIRSSVERSLDGIRGSAGDRITLTNRINEQAQMIANLEAELERRNNERDAQIQQLTDELESTRDTLQRVQRDIDEKQTQLDGLRLLQSQVGDNARLSARIQELELQISERQTRFNEMVLNKDTKISEKKREIERLQSEKAECEINRERLEEEKQNLEERLLRVQAELAANPAPAPQQAPPPELEQLREELTQCRRQTEAAIAQKERVEQEKDRVQADLDQAQSDLRIQRDDAKAADTRASEIESTLRRVENKIQECERKESELLREQQNLATQLEDKVRGNTELEQQVNRLQLNLTGNLDALEALREKDRELEEEKKGREEEKQQNQAERQRLERDIENKEQERRRLEEEKQQNQAERQRLEQEIENKEQERRQALEQLRATTDSLGSDQKEAAERLQERNQQLNEVKEQQRQLRDRVSDLEAESKQLQEERPIAAAKIAELENKVQDLGREKEAISEQVRQKEAEVGTAAERLRDTQQQLVDKEQENDRQQAVIAQLQNENLLKEGEAQRLSGELERLREQARLNGETGESLQARLVAAEAKRAELEREKQQLEAKVSDEQAAKAERETELRAAQGQLQDVSRQLADLSEREQALQEEKERLVAAAAVQERIKGEVSEAHRQKEREWEEKKAQLEEENQQLNERARDLTTEQKTAEIEKGNLAGQIARLEGEVATGRQELQQLRDTSAQSAGEQAAALNAQIRDKEAALQDLGQQLQQKENEVAAAREQAVRDLAAKDNLIAQKTSELQESCRQSLQLVNNALEEERKERENASREFERVKGELEQSVSDKESRIARLNNEMRTETDRLNAAKAIVEEKLRLSDEEKAALRDQVEAYRAIGGSVQEVKDLIAEQERQITQGREQLDQLRRDAEGTAANVRQEMEANRRTIADLEQKVQEAAQQKDLSIRDKEQIQQQLDQIRAQKDELDSQIQIATGVEQGLRRQVEEFQQRLADLQAEKERQIRELNDAFRQRCPSAMGDLSDLLVEGLENVNVIDLTEEEIDKFANNMTKAIEAYSRLARASVYAINVNKEQFGTGCLNQYILPCVYMFHAWKCMLRLPFVLRSGVPLPDQSYFYPVPAPVEADQVGRPRIQGNEEQKMAHPEEELQLMIANDTIWRTYTDKIQNGRMRIDILLYYIVVGLIKKMTSLNQQCSNRDAEYQALLKYIIALLKHANTELATLATKLGSIIGTTADAVRVQHNSSNPVLTFLRMSSKTPDQPNVRFDYNIEANNKVFHVKYSGQDEPFYIEDEKINEYVLREPPNVIYDGDYHFGPFTHIFRDRERNDEIVRNAVFQANVEDRLRDGKPVCIIGYGASGSGKTTTLVYADYFTKENGRPVRVQLPGILILLAKNLANAKGAKLGYKTCSVQIYELEANQAENGASGVCRKFPGSRETIERVVRLGESTIVRNSVPFTNCDDGKESIDYQNVGGEWKRQITVTGPNGRSEQVQEGLEKELVDYINIKRNIAPSPNNPQSSRSHVIAKLIFRDPQTGRETTLLVCDFAGVENRFNCADPASLDIMGYELLVQEIFKGYIDKARAFWVDQFNVWGLREQAMPEQDTIYSYLESSIAGRNYRFQYVDITRFPTGLITKVRRIPDLQKIQDMLEVCQSLHSQLSNVVLVNTDTAQKNVRTYVLDWLYGVKESQIRLFDGRRILINILDSKKKWNEVTHSPKDNKALEHYSETWGVIWDSVTTLPGYVPLKDLYVSVTKTKAANVPTLLSIPFLVRLTRWFLTSWIDGQDEKGFPLLDILTQSYISYKLRVEKEEEKREQDKTPEEKKEEEKLEDRLFSKDKLDTFMKVSICRTRVNEGVYINQSLAELRKFIADTVQNTRAKGSVAPFIDVCAPLQCNPYYRDCFGQINYHDQFERPFVLKPPGAYGLLSKYIMNVANAENMTFCIFNVLNLSRDANNPPKSPYIDITELQIEYEKLLAYLDSSRSSQERLLGMSQGRTQTLVDAVTRLQSDIASIPLASGIKPSVDSYCREILQGNDVRANLTRLIDMITNFNAITPIGTLEFTDMMAKFAINRVTCNLAPTLPRGPALPVVRPLRIPPPTASPVGSRSASPSATRPSISIPPSPTAAARVPPSPGVPRPGPMSASSTGPARASYSAAAAPVPVPVTGPSQEEIDREIQQRLQRLGINQENVIQQQGRTRRR